MKCEWEQRMIEATQSGVWTSSLRAHLQACARCAQTELIAASLQEGTGRPVRMLDLPPAGMIWRRAQAMRKESELRRATRRPLLIAGTLGAVYSVVFVLWGIVQLPQSVYRQLLTSPALTGNVVLAGAVLSAILAILGSFVLVL